VEIAAAQGAQPSGYSNRIEFLNGDRCIAHLGINAADHPIQPGAGKR
jgi:hypothetical protein